MTLLYTKYRIVTDEAECYRAEYRPWWSPFWMTCSSFDGGWMLSARRHPTAHAAMLFIKAHKKRRGHSPEVVWEE